MNEKIVTRSLLFIVLPIFSIVMTLSIIDMNNSHLGRGSSYDTKYWAGECINCKSDETEKYHTFWYDDEMLCTGSDEYCIDNADYTIAKCHQCGYTWKIYL